MALIEILTENPNRAVNTHVAKATRLITATALGGTVEVYTFVSETQGQTPIDYLLRVTAVPRPDHAAKHQDIINTLGEKFPGHTFSILPRFITPDEESAMVATPRSES